MPTSSKPYPYLLVEHPLYGKFPDYKTASDAIRAATQEEAEAYVHEVWPHAYLYEHGPEYTIVPMSWRDIDRLRKEGFDIPGNLCMTRVWPTSSYRTSFEPTTRKYTQTPIAEELQAPRVLYMWRLAAATMIEKSRTKELAQNANFI